MSNVIIPIVAVAASAALGIAAALVVPSMSSGDNSESVAVEEPEPEYGYLSNDGFTYSYEPDGGHKRVAIVIKDVMGNANVFTHPGQEYLGTLPELVKQGLIYE